MVSPLVQFVYSKVPPNVEIHWDLTHNLQQSDNGVSMCKMYIVYMAWFVRIIQIYTTNMSITIHLLAWYRINPCHREWLANQRISQVLCGSTIYLQRDQPSHSLIHHVYAG